MAFPRSLSVGAVVAGTALVYHVRRRHQTTGQSYMQIIRQLPSDAQLWATRTRERAARAIEDGRKAARHREDELTRQLEAARPPSGAPV